MLSLGKEPWTTIQLCVLAEHGSLPLWKKHQALGSVLLYIVTRSIS